MADTQILLETIVSGLSNLKQQQDDLIDELNGFEDQYSKDYKIVNERLDAINVQIDKTIKEAIKSIKIPEAINGKDGKDFDKEIATKLLKEELNKLVKQKNLDIGKFKSEILQAVNEIEIPKGEKGENGESATNEQIQDNVSAWIEENFELLQGDKGEKGERGLIGQQGQNGNDGVGIEDIERSQDDLLITLTDGTEKRIALPKPKHIGGGGGVSYQVATSTLIVSTDKDLILKPVSQNVLINASSGNINVTLPNPVDCFSANRSYRIGITRTDTSDNIANILSHDGELILNDASQTLLASEVINLVTDNINWYYGS